MFIFFFPWLYQNVQWACVNQHYWGGTICVQDIFCKTPKVWLDLCTKDSSRCLCLKNWNNWYCKSLLFRSVKRETLKLIETFLDKAEDQPHIGKQFVPPMMESVLGDYARNVPDARESEVLSLFATIINKYDSYSTWGCLPSASFWMFTMLQDFYFDCFSQVQGNNVGWCASHIWSCFPVYIGGNSFMDCVFDGLNKLTWRSYLCFVYLIDTFHSSFCRW